MKILILCHFDYLRGPIIFLRAPESIQNRILEQIPPLMNLYDNGFFMHMVGELRSANYIFDIPSEYMRGGQELLLISILSTEGEIDASLSQEILNKFVGEFKEIEDAYKAFYINSMDYKGDADKLKQVQELFSLFFNSIPEENITLKRSEAKVFVYGLSNAGKTTIIKNLEKSITKNTIPTTNVEISRVLINNVSLLTYDAPGQELFRDLWKPYLKNQSGLVYVLDITDKERFIEARDVLHKIANSPEMSNLPLLILLNKVDLEHPNIEELTNQLELNKFEDRSVKYFLTSGLTNENIIKAFNWLALKLPESFKPFREIDLGIIFSRWDKTSGLKIIATYPNDAFEDPEVISIRCFSISQFVFGGESFKKVSFILPFIHLKAKAAIYFDYIPDENIRGGMLPLSLLIFYNESVPNAIINSFNDIIFENFDIIKEHYTDSRSVLSDLIDLHKSIQILINSFKPTMEALRGAELRYKALFKAAGDAILIIDHSLGIILDGNEQAGNLFDRSLDKIIGLHITQLQLTEEFEKFKLQIIKQREIKNLPPIMTWVRKPDGTNIPVEVSVSETQMEGKYLLQCIFHNITDRISAENKLREAEVRYRTIFEQSPDGVMIIDPETLRATEFNEGICNLLGYSQIEFAKLRINDYDASENPVETKARVERILKVGREDFETKFRTKSGDIKEMYITVQLIKLAGRGYFHSICRDITQQKQIERDIADLAKFPSENPNPVLRVDNSKIIYSNQAGQNFFDVTKDSKIPKMLQDIINEAFDKNLIKKTEIELKDQVYSFTISPIQDKGYANIYGMNVTQQKQIERQIADLAKFPSENPNPVIRANHSKIIYANKAGRKLFKIKNDSMIPEMLQNEIDMAFYEDSIKKIEIKQKDQFYTFTISPIKTDGYVNIYGLNITDRKKVEEDLNQNQLRYSELFHGSNDAIFLHDYYGNIYDANKKALEMYGYNIKELRSIQISDLSPSTEIDTIVEMGKIINEKGSAKFEFIAKKKNDETFLADVSSKILTISGQELIQAIVRDITNRKLAEEKLLESQHNLGERVKELNCLYGISQLVENQERSFTEIIQGTLTLIPPAWQFPELTCARIIFNEKSYETEYFKETTWRLTVHVEVNNKDLEIEVYYLEDKPFLKEEISLINEIVTRLKVICERMEAEEDLKLFNEELKLAEIKLRNANIELRASEDNQRTANEELSIINSELETQVTIINEVNIELKKLMDSVDHAIIFLDNKLKILRFNSPSVDIVNLIESDVGRPITQLTNILNYDHLEEDLNSVLTTQTLKQNDVSTTKGDWFMVKIIPISKTKEMNKGLILMFLDITERKHDEQQISDSERKMIILNETFLKFGNDPITNIQILVETVGTLLKADNAFYNKIVDINGTEMLKTVAILHKPDDFESEVNAIGHICTEFIQNDDDDLIIIKDLDKSKFMKTDPGVQMLNLKQYFGAKVKLDNKPVGSFCLVYRENQKITEADKNIVRLLSRSVAIEEQRWKAQRKLEKSEQLLVSSREELAVRNQISNVFLTMPDDGIYSAVLSIVLRTLDSDQGYFGFINDKGDLVCPSLTKDVWDECNIQDKNIIFPHDMWGGLWGKSLNKKKSLFSTGPFKLPEGHIALRNALSVPIVHQKELIGQIVVGNSINDFTRHDQNLLETIANFISPILFLRLERKQYEIDRIKIEKELKKSEETYRSLFNGSPLFLILLNLDGTIYDINPTVEKLVGYKKQELINHDFRDLPLLPPHSIPTAIGGFKSLSLGKIPQPLDIPFLTKDGEERWGTFQGSLLTLGNKQVIQIIGQDITNRKRVEEKLRESEEKFRNISDLSLIGFCVLQDDVVKYANQQIAEMYGYSIQEMLDWQPGDFIKVIHPDDKDLVAKQARKKQEGNNNAVTHYQFRGVKKTGEMIWVDNYSKTISYEGKPADLIADFEITQKKRIEQKLINSKQKFKTFFHNASDAIFIINQQGQFLDVNKTARERLGYSKAEFLKMTPNDIVSPESKIKLKEGINTTLKKGRMFTEIVHMTRDGRSIPTELHSREIEFDGKPAILGIARDITDRKQAEKELQAIITSTRSILKYSTFDDVAKNIFDTSKELMGVEIGYVAVLSKDGERYEKIFIDAQSNQCHVDPERSMSVNRFQAIMAKSKGAMYLNDFSGNFLFKALPKGHAKVKNIMLVPLNIKGKTIGILVMANKPSDFTRRDKEIAMEFTDLAAIALNNSLMLESLQESQSQYKEAYVRSEFYKDLVTHDINKILNNISTGTELVNLYKKIPEREGEVDELLEIISKQISRGVKLAENVRKLTIIEESEFVLQKVDLLSVLNSVIKSIDESFQKRHILITVDSELENEKFHVQANEFLADIFENIFLNSIKYNESPIVKIEVKCTKIIEATKSLIKLEFKDNGIGIPDARKKLIFQKRTSVDENVRGLGIALSLVQRIVENYRGKIWVEDKIPLDYKKGSNFVVILPEAKQKIFPLL